MKVVNSCPLGHTCEKAIDSDTIERCWWFVEVEGMHPATGQPVRDRMCAITSSLLFSATMGRELRGAAAAVESLRNTAARRIEMVVSEGALTHESDSVFRGELPAG
jgi:hypothetical protein